MKMRKFLHIAAVMISSLMAMITHGRAQEAGASPSPSSSKEKKGESVSRHHRHHTSAAEESALDDPPRHHSKIVPDLDSGNSASIKNSRHAATWTSYDSQAESDAPPVKIDRSLMESADTSNVPFSTSAIVPQPAPPPLPGDEQSRYPWKRQIVTTTFWIGETPTHNNPVPNSASCWDPHWAANYGGNDAPDTAQRSAEYTPVSFIPKQNPFYVALPYNDMEHGTHKAEAAQVIPWFARDYKGASQSVCQGRWIAIRFRNKVCYAQWEDAGPFETDHWQYVFGNERPRPNLNGGAGLDVSPAVRDYLGIDSTDVTDWKFVDFEEVPTGPWARFGSNNTFVQNGQKSSTPVVELTPDVPNGHGVLPGMEAPTVEIR
jgi:hypothetical protein